MEQKQNELMLNKDNTNSKKSFKILDEGSIDHFLSDEEKEKMKDFAINLNKLTNRHLNK